MKKKLLLIVALTVMTLAMAGCGKKPAATVEAFCKALQASDDATLSTLMVDGEYDADEAETNEFADYIKELNSNIKYKIGESSVDKDTAEVTVDFTYSDASQVIGETFTDYMSQVFQMAFSGEEFSEEKADQLLIDILSEKRESVELGEAEKTVVISLTKVDGKWLINSVPDEVMDVASGNIVSAISNFAAGLDDSEEE